MINEMATHAQTNARVEGAPTRYRIEEDGTCGSAQTILFVEDEAFVRDVTREVLQSAGYRVLTAKNAAEALCLYQQNSGNVDLLLSDVVLPGETGSALAGKLRRENPFLKILLVTGYAEQMGLQKTRPEELLAKPFSTETLLRRVRQLLDCGQHQIGIEEVVRSAVTRSLQNLARYVAKRYHP